MKITAMLIYEPESQEDCDKIKCTQCAYSLTLKQICPSCYGTGEW